MLLTQNELSMGVPVMTNSPPNHHHHPHHRLGHRGIYNVPGVPPPGRLAPLNWASVASWFFSSPLTTCNSITTSTTTITTTTTSCRQSSSVDHHHVHHHHQNHHRPFTTTLAPTICTAIRCTVPSCSCECFTPGKLNIRYCDTCNHSWVPHALDKLGFRHLFGQSPVEPVQPNVAFDIASLVLYGCQALPIRLKILLDRLFSVLQREEVLQVLHGFGWTHEDYARGYILQEPHGGVLDRWNICSPEEEPLVLQQFLRFGETRAITQQLLLAQQGALPVSAPSSTSVTTNNETRSITSISNLHQLRIDSDIKKFIDRTSSAPTTPTSTKQDTYHRSHKHRTLSPTRRPSSPTTTASHQVPHHHHSHHHNQPSSLSLHHPPSSQPTCNTALPPRPPPPPPMSPLQKQQPLNFMKFPSAAVSLPSATVSNGPLNSVTSPSSSINNSPLSVSPLNRLQNMQPFDFRKMGTTGYPGMVSSRSSPEIQHARRRISETSESSPPGLMNLSLTSPTSLCLPPPPPPPPPVTGIPVTFNHSAAMAAAAAAAGVPFSAANLVASSLPGLISSVSTQGSKSPSAMTSDFMSVGGSSEFGSDDDDDDDDDTHSALNLSRDGAINQKPRGPRPGHIRKTTTPMKRQWGTSAELPLNLGTQLINPATGKKRVQCNVCLKTFCDKGALKIHFSAVHLREMHKCTVEGCNMMFSSRRSRNRHSANPNPKLHSPHLRRKISPHDGRTAQSHPLLIPPPGGLSLSAALNPLSFAPFPLLTPPPELRHQHSLLNPCLDSKQSLDLSMHKFDERRMDIRNRLSPLDDSSTAMNSNSQSNIDDDNDDTYDDDEEDGIVVDGGIDDDDPDVGDENISEMVPDKNENYGTDQMAKRIKLSESDFDEISSNIDSNEDSSSVMDSQSVKEDNVTLGQSGDASTFSSKGVRKRKSQNPLRCAIPAVMDHSDTMTDEESSNDVAFHAAASPEENYKEHVLLNEQETQPQEEDQDKNIHHSNHDSFLQEDKMNSPSQNKEVEREHCLENQSENEQANETNSIKKNFNTESVENSSTEDCKRESEEIHENEYENESLQASAEELKHECLEEKENEDMDQERSEKGEGSEGSHNSEESLDSSNALRQLETLSHGPLGDLMMSRSALNLSGLNSHQHTPPHSPFLGQTQFPPLGFMMNTEPPSPTRSQASSGTSNGPDSPSEESQGIYFNDGGFISNMDVPIDKDNPRRCTACGKIFQNHFGVKTHFQNVHLKLMHKCTVEGCNAAFPSKRSRDRHSANLNLHRKLLSTSSNDKIGASLFMDKSPFSSFSGNAVMHNEFLARLYAESQSLPLALDAFKNMPHPQLPPPSTTSTGSLAEHIMLNGDRLPPPHPSLLLPPLGGLSGFPGLNNFAGHIASSLAPGINGTSLVDKKDRSSGSNSPKSPVSMSGDTGHQSPTPLNAKISLVYCAEEDSPVTDQDGQSICNFCRQTFSDINRLKEHYTQSHLSEMYRCTVAGCDKVFSSRSRRNLHSENETLHTGMNCS